MYHDVVKGLDIPVSAVTPEATNELACPVDSRAQEWAEKARGGLRERQKERPQGLPDQYAFCVLLAYNTFRSLFPFVMAVKSYVLSGNLGTDLSFPIGRTENILVGTWEMCFSSISFQYSETHAQVILRITTNLVMGKGVNEKSELTGEPTTLNLVLVRPVSGTLALVGFRQRDYFEINNAQQDMVIHITNLTEGPLPNAKVFLHVLLKRVR